MDRDDANKRIPLPPAVARIYEAVEEREGPGEPAWMVAGPMGKNGQRVVSLARLGQIAQAASEPENLR